MGSFPETVFNRTKNRPAPCAHSLEIELPLFKVVPFFYSNFFPYVFTQSSICFTNVNTNVPHPFHFNNIGYIQYCNYFPSPELIIAHFRQLRLASI